MLAKYQTCSLQEHFTNGKPEKLGFLFLGHIHSNATVKNKPLSLSKN